MLKLIPLREYTSSISSLPVFCSMLTCTTRRKSQQLCSFPLCLPHSPHSLKHLSSSLCFVSFTLPLSMPVDVEQTHGLLGKASQKGKRFQSNKCRNKQHNPGPFRSSLGLFQPLVERREATKQCKSLSGVFLNDFVDTLSIW